MHSISRRVLCLSAGIAALSSLAIGNAFAQGAYPSRTVTLVVPYPAGGASDALGRVLASHLASEWGQAVVVENRAGAGGTIGIDAVSKMPPDGYNLVLGVTGGLTIAPHMRELPYSPTEDLAPISLVGVSPGMLAVHPSIPVSSVDELIAYAKERPGQLAYGSAGVGSSVHIAAELFKSMADVDMLHVPYKGGAPSVQALLSGEVAMVIETVPSLLPHAQAGKVKGLAVTTASPAAAAPDLPSIADTLPGYEVATWFGLFAPAGTPAAVVDKIYEGVASAMAQPEIKERLAALGIDPVASTPAELADYVNEEYERFGEVIRAADIKME